MFPGILSSSLIKKAQEKNLIQIEVIDLRKFTKDKHKTADDTPYGGGPGMLLKAEPIFEALKEFKPNDLSRIILTCPTGEPFSHKKAQDLSEAKEIIILCGHYEGVDERIRQNLITDEISIGDYVLTGGELPALVILDAVCRFIPEVVKESESVERDSFFSGLLDYPSYTKPEEFKEEKVPEVLLSGHHERIDRYRRRESLRKTLFKRPDLLPHATLKDEDRILFEEIIQNG